MRESFEVRHIETREVRIVPLRCLPNLKDAIVKAERRTGEAGSDRRGMPLAEERRLETLRATRRVIAREGFDKASLRAIARELGTTTGVLTHHFRNKEEILDLVLHATRHGKYDGRFPPDAPIADLIDALTSTLPHSSLDGWKVFFAFLAYIFPQTDKAARYADDFERWRLTWATVIRAQIERGVIRADVDPQLAADTLLCLFEGAGVHGTVSPDSFGARRQNAVVESYFRSLLADPAKPSPGRSPAPGATPRVGAVTAKKRGGGGRPAGAAPVAPEPVPGGRFLRKRRSRRRRWRGPRPDIRRGRAG
jgi:AcrR family transcriptional regulator